MVVEEGGEARTINLCQQCYNEKFVQQGKQPLDLWAWQGVVEKEAPRGRLWKVSGSEQFLEYSTLERATGRCSGKNRKDYKVSGNRSLHPERF